MTNPAFRVILAETHRPLIMRCTLHAVCLALPAFAAEPPKEHAEFFESKVRPLLAEKCFSCHSESAKKSKGGLTLDTLAGVFRDNDGQNLDIKPTEAKARTALINPRAAAWADLCHVLLNASEFLYVE